MATTTLQSNLVPINISSDGGSTYKAIVCKKSWTFNGDTSTTEEETDCGTLTGIGSNKWSFDFEAVMNTTPASSEFSTEDLLGFWVGQTALKVKAYYPITPGTDIYLQGDCYLTSFKINNQVGNLMTCSGTLTGTGQLDNTP